MTSNAPGGYHSPNGPSEHHLDKPSPAASASNDPAALFRPAYDLSAASPVGPLPGYTPVPRGRQRLGGAFIALVGAGIAAVVRNQALTEGQFSFSGGLVEPALAVLGLALVAFLGDK